jgi:type II secretory pathway component PulF
MATFRYQVAGSRDATGSRGVAGSTAAATTAVAGDGDARTIDAADRTAAVRALQARGITPSRVEPVSPRSPNAGRAARRGRQSTDANADASAADARSPGFGRRVMSRAELTNFVGELATAVRAGLPIVPALRTMAGAGRSPAQRVMLTAVIDDVEKGKSLADAMRAVGKPFNDLIVSMVHAGEVSGKLDDVLAQAANLLTKDQKLRRALTSALVYPALLTLAIVGAIVVLVTVIVPNILAAVEGQIESLPLPTLIVQEVAAFFGAWWWAVLLALAAATIAWRRLYATPAPREAIDRFFLKVPVLGRLLRDVAVARFTRTFGTLVGAGLPVLNALKITKRTLGNKALEREIDSVCDDVSHGATIAEPLEASGYFPALLVQITALGERTGKLDETLLHAADAFEERTEQSVKVFTQVLPPLLIIMLALVVGFVVLAVMLPLVELQGAIG